ncbi:MAG: hypothetical protein QM808_09320 [Steroidobacteraceae bacterium]
MNHSTRVRRQIIRTCLLGSVIALASLNDYSLTAQAAETAKTTKPTRTWADIAKWPKFEGGIWVRERGPRGNDTAPKYQPDVAAKLAAIGPIAPSSLGNSSCEPLGGPFERTGEFFFSKDSIFMMMDEDYLSVRHIHLDTTDHGDPDPSYYGHSIGHWEGDTLVIDTVGFLPGVTIAPKVEGQGATHTIERIRLTSPDTLEQQITIMNPKVLTAPYTTTQKFKIRRDLHVQEAFCSQNNRDINGEPNLTPP